MAIRVPHTPPGPFPRRPTQAVVAVLMRRTLIHVPRELIRSCAAELSSFPEWKRRPCTSLKMLISGLNDIFHQHPLLKYRDCFPQPLVAVRELEGIRRLSQGSNKRGRDAVVKRMEELIRRDTDSYGSLLWEAARTIDNDVPERAYNDRTALDERLREIARTQPGQLADMSTQALERLRPLAGKGRGGARNSSLKVRQHLILAVGLLFDSIKKESPGVTNDHVNYKGPFVRFAQHVFTEARSETWDA